MVAIDSGAGLANATLQLRLTAVRLFFDFLVEEQIRDRNPVTRGYRARGRVGQDGGVWLPRFSVAAVDPDGRAVAGGVGGRRRRVAAELG